MKKLVIGIGIILFVIAIGFAVYLLSQGQPSTDPADGPTGGRPLFPSGSTNTGTPQDMRTLRLSTGEAVQVNDFVNNGITFKDPANEGSYYLAGELPYCLDDGTCPTTSTPAFSILYLEPDQGFTVSLNQEPLGSSRLQAENYLQQALGISRERMCELTYTVGTTVSVNEVYGSITNLGFSFCPNATKLP